LKNSRDAILEIWNCDILASKSLVFGQCLQHVRLTQRQTDLFMFIVDRDDEIFDLDKAQ
jgi:hypothetical protein